MIARRCRQLQQVPATCRRCCAHRGIKTGILGLPNVGKSSLFNALTQNDAKAENFPFCTIDPNVGIVPVPDPQLATLAQLYNSEREVPTNLEFVDIAGLVAGASKGEGLGNKFLANVRECDALVHVVRCFEDENIVHVSSQIDPAADMEVIRLELVLADLDQVERRLERLTRGKARAMQQSADGTSNLEAEASALAKILPALEDGRCARSVDLEEEEALAVRPLGLLSLKPVVLAANVAEDALGLCAQMLDSSVGDGGGEAQDSDAARHFVALRDAAAASGLSPPLVVSSRVESELALLPDEDRAMFLEELGLDASACARVDSPVGLAPLIRAAREVLQLITFYTAGPTEARAWTVERDSLAPRAAGRIHSDFERGFIAAETCSFDDLVAAGGERGAKAAGLVRSEGKDYVVQDGDVMLFRFNV